MLNSHRNWGYGSGLSELSPEWNAAGISLLVSPVTTVLRITENDCKVMKFL